MAKIIRNPVEVVLRFTKDGVVWTVSGWTQYHMGVTEYPDIIGKQKSLDLTFSEQERSAIVQFAGNVIYPQIANAEQIS